MASLREIRMRKGLSSVELAIKAKVSNSTVWQIEAGTRKPSIETMKALALALELPYETVFDAIYGTDAAVAVSPALEPEFAEATR